MEIYGTILYYINRKNAGGQREIRNVALKIWKHEKLLKPRVEKIKKKGTIRKNRKHKKK